MFLPSFFVSLSSVLVVVVDDDDVLFFLRHRFIPKKVPCQPNLHSRVSSCSDILHLRDMHAYSVPILMLGIENLFCLFNSPANGIDVLLSQCENIKDLIKGRARIRYRSLNFVHTLANEPILCNDT